MAKRERESAKERHTEDISLCRLYHTFVGSALCSSRAGWFVGCYCHTMRRNDEINIINESYTHTHGLACALKFCKEKHYIEMKIRSSRCCCNGVLRDLRSLFSFSYSRLQRRVCVMLRSLLEVHLFFFFFARCSPNTFSRSNPANMMGSNGDRAKEREK